MINLKEIFELFIVVSISSIIGLILIRVATKIIVKTFFEEKNKNNKKE